MKKNKRLFTIVVLVYNNEPTIGHLLNQLMLIDRNYNLEVLILYTISKDRSLEVIKTKIQKFRKCFVYKIKKRDFNHSITRNKAIYLASGTYICFLSGDVSIKTLDFIDYFEKDFALSKSIVAIYGKQIPKDDCNFHSRLENFCTFSYLDKRTDKNGVYIQSSKTTLHNSYRDYFISNVFSCYKREFLIKHPFPRVKQGEDIALGKVIIELGKNILYDSHCLVVHSHNYNLSEYYLIQKDSLRLKNSDSNYYIGSSICCKLSYISGLKVNFVQKIYYLFLIIFYYLIKVIAYIEINIQK